RDAPSRRRAARRTDEDPRPGARARADPPAFREHGPGPRGQRAGYAVFSAETLPPARARRHGWARAERARRTVRKDASMRWRAYEQPSPAQLGKILLIAFGLTIACFLASTVAAERAGWGIRAAAGSIVANSSASVSKLAATRTMLRHLEVLIDD